MSGELPIDLSTFSSQIPLVIRSLCQPQVHVIGMRKSIPIESGHFLSIDHFMDLDSAHEYSSASFLDCRLLSNYHNFGVSASNPLASSKARLPSLGKNQDRIGSLSPPLRAAISLGEEGEVEEQT